MHVARENRFAGLRRGADKFLRQARLTKIANDVLRGVPTACRTLNSWRFSLKKQNREQIIFGMNARDDGRNIRRATRRGSSVSAMTDETSMQIIEQVRAFAELNRCALTRV